MSAKFVRNNYLIWINFSLMYVKGIPRLGMIPEAEQTEFPFTMSSPGHHRSQIGPHATAHGERVVNHQDDKPECIQTPAIICRISEAQQPSSRRKTFFQNTRMPR
jgi:hypothetical protein